MSKKITRREFVRISGLGIGGLALGGSFFACNSGSRVPDANFPSRFTAFTQTPTYCGMCPCQCAEFVLQKKEKPWRIIGNSLDQYCGRRMCTVSAGGIGIYNHPDRLKTPLIRTGEKGTQSFRRANWDEAFDYIASKLKVISDRYGSESVALFSSDTSGSFFKTLLQAYGSNTIVDTSCANLQWPREVAYRLTFGDIVGIPERIDFKHSECIILINPQAGEIGEDNNGLQANELAEAIRKGSVLIVADPRFSVMASKSKYWLPLKPATEVALLLSWIHVIIEEKLYDRRYIDRYTIGFEKLKKSVKENTPEWAYSITTIEPELIRRTAREMAFHAPASIVYSGRNVAWYGDDTQRMRAEAILNALLGNWGQSGGFYLSSGAKVSPYPHPEFPKSEDRGNKTLPRQFKLTRHLTAPEVCDMTIPSPNGNFTFKGWFVHGPDLVSAQSDIGKTINAIQRLDLLVVIDSFPSELAGWADVVLPECSYIERYDDIGIQQGRTTQIALRMPAFKPKYNTKPTWWMAKQLADKMKLGKFFPWKNIEAYLDFRLKKIGSSLKEMKTMGVKQIKRKTPLYFGKGQEIKFNTPSGKAELYSSTLEEQGFDPVPKYTIHEQPKDRYYRLIYGRSPSLRTGGTIGNPLLVQLVPENEVWVNTSVAARWGLANRQDIRLENQEGKLSAKIRVKVTERVRPDCIYLACGFGSDRQNLGSLISKGRVDPVVGVSGERSSFVTFRV